jgi:hypothetical protein
MKNAIENQLAAIKGCNKSEIKNINLAVGTFEKGSGIFCFELTKTGKVKSNSVKYFTAIESYNNCSY